MDKLNFNTEKHDENVKEKLAHRIKLQAGKIWTDWKNRVLRLPKGKRTRKHIVKMMVDLRKELYLLADQPEVGPWKSYTLEILDDAIERANISFGLSKNVLTEYVPTYSKKKPESWEFGTLVEFGVIPVVVKHREMGAKFLREGNQILALHGDGELEKVGQVRCSDGIGLIPTVAAYRAELEASGPAPGADPGPPEPGSNPGTGPATPGSDPGTGPATPGSPSLN